MDGRTTAEDEGAGAMTSRTGSVPAQPESGATRQTRQRTAVDELLSDTTAFSTAAQIHAALAERGDRVGMATVYRTLQRMSEAGALDAIRTDEGEVAYRRCSRSHHHHLVCRTCGLAVEVTGPPVEAWTARVAAEHGFTGVSHDLEIFGQCAACAAKADAGTS